jgi:hypothetical protein
VPHDLLHENEAGYESRLRKLDEKTPGSSERSLLSASCSPSICWLRAPELLEG